MNGYLIAASVGCNRVVGCLDWGPNNLVAFGSANFITIYDIESERIVGVLNGHTKQVNCIKWINSSNKSLNGYLVSGSADGNLRVWQWKSESSHSISTLTVLNSSINSIAILAQNSSVFIASCCTNPGILILRCTIDNASEIPLTKSTNQESVSTNNIIQLSLAMIELPVLDGRILLASSGTDSNVRLFVQSDSDVFTSVCILRGHENWIRSLDFYLVKQQQQQQQRSKLYLASASQDRFARVWSISSNQSHSGRGSLSQLAPSMSFLVSEVEFCVKLDGLLSGHEDWVHSVKFTSSSTDEIELLTVSMDRTIIVWRLDINQNWWIQHSSVGDAGVSSLGYYTVSSSPDSTSIVTHGYSGSLHLWKRDSKGNWKATSANTGHFSGVVDIKFVTGRGIDRVCLFSVSKDQTMRIWTVVEDNWCEIARPQVHGHDFNELTTIPVSSPLAFVSCSEEKVLRVFQAPVVFYQYLQLHGLSPDLPPYDDSVPYGASIKALALTNTAVYEGVEPESIQSTGVVDEYTPGPDLAPRSAPHVASGTPLEEHLSQNTLWPEIQKLYGHGDVVYCVDCSPCGRYLASACKAQREDVAVIFLWDTQSWTAKQQLKGHSLTVTRLQFSPTGRYLLSGSRDRTFCVFIRQGDEFELLVTRKKAHGRIIWDVSWTDNEMHFATGSRDQTVKIWSVMECELVHTISFKAPVTALSFQLSSIGTNLLAVGLDNGQVEVWRVTMTDHGVVSEIQWTADEHSRHSGTVHQLCWSSSEALGLKIPSSLILASCSADHSIRLFQLTNKK